jgi:hypothetical protein
MSLIDSTDHAPEGHDLPDAGELFPEITQVSRQVGVKPPGDQPSANLPTAEDDLGPRPELPTAEEDLGPRPKLPDVNEVLPEQPQRRPVTGTVAPGPLGDWLFGDTRQSSLARIMHAFGETVHQDVGDWGDKLAMSEDTKKFLRDKGVFNDYVNGQASVLKSYNETFLRSAAVAVNTALYGVPAVIHGAQEAVAEAGRQAGETSFGRAIGAESAARDLAAAAEAFPTFEHPNLPKANALPQRPLTTMEVLGLKERPALPEAFPTFEHPNPPKAGALPERALGGGEFPPPETTLEERPAPAQLVHPLVPEALAPARDLNVIGPGGEAAWLGTAKEPDVLASSVLPKAGAAEAPLSPNPNTHFTTPATDLIDKAGNIRLDKFATSDDVDEIIRITARTNGAFLEQRRGALSDGQTLELAEALGMDPSWLDQKKLGDAYNIEEIRAARRLLVQSATNVRDAMIAAKDGDIEAVQNLGEAIARHEMIQGKVSGATAEAGRALRAFREVIPGQSDLASVSRILETETGRTFFQLQQMAALGARLSPSQVSRLVFDTKNGSIKQAVLYYYVNSLISGPITHARYFFGNALTAMWAPVKTTAAAGIDSALTGLRLQDERRLFFGEAGAEILALGKGSREGVKAFLNGWRTGNTPHLPGEAPPQLFEAQPIAPAIPGVVGQVIGYPGKAVGAIHGFSSAVRYEQEIAKLAYRQAMREALSGDAFNNRVADLGNRPTPEMTEAAALVARKDLYMAHADFNSLEAKVTRIANHNIVSKLILPFTKIGTQIATQALENSPAGLFMGKVRENLSGKNGIETRNTQMASIFASTALMGMMAEFAAEGLATGAGPAEPGVAPHAQSIFADDRPGLDPVSWAGHARHADGDRHQRLRDVSRVGRAGAGT